MATSKRPRLLLSLCVPNIPRPHVTVIDLSRQACSASITSSRPTTRTASPSRGLPLPTPSSKSCIDFFTYQRDSTLAALELFCSMVRHIFFMLGFQHDLHRRCDSKFGGLGEER